MRQFKQYSINIDGNLVSLDKPKIMGILNVTPDSFFSESRCDNEAKIRERVNTIINEGADIIDIGGYSSRPFAKDISCKEECERLFTGLQIIKEIAPNIPISVDTFRSEVAAQCINKFGPLIINDISGGNLDSDMFATVADLNVPYILMHMRGNPSTMTNLTDYDNVTTDVIQDLAKKVDKLTLLGVNDIIIDPGYGFSKTVKQNYELMANLSEFFVFNMPVLVGISRKSMIYKPLNLTAETSLSGTIALNTMAMLEGAHVIRVHDVKEAVQARNIVELIRNNQ